ncbi:hypothetical protein CVS40_11745 [Lucilia cuprina]|nr:hypothetical protein CVS40_11745 [Lucilia cuprina]
MNEVKSTYQTYLDYLATSDTTEPDDIDVVSSKYQLTYNAFVNCLSNIKERYYMYAQAQKTNDSPEVSQNNTETHHSLVVPPCDVKTQSITSSERKLLSHTSTSVV